MIVSLPVSWPLGKLNYSVNLLQSPQAKLDSLIAYIHVSCFLTQT